MILEYRCKNFMSFEDEIEFTAYPVRMSNNYRDNVFTYAKNRHAIKSAVIFGENTGGKTNFIKSLEFLKNFILGRINRELYKDLTYLKNAEKQEFYLKCLIGDRIYIYELVLSKIGIEYERSYTMKINETDEVTILEWTYEEDNNLMKKELGSVKNITYLKIEFEYLEIFNDWLRDNLIIELNEQTDRWINNIEKNDDLIKIIESEEFFEIFKIIDSSITGIRVDKNKPYVYSQIVRAIDNNDVFVVDIKDDSMGVQEFFKIAINLYKVIYKNCVVVADEVDRVLNVIISNKIIKLIHGNEHKGQFIFTTHNIINLDARVFMKSQIYFITKKEDSLSSELYSLADFKELRNENKDIYKYYLKGMLGGTPNV